MFAPSVGLSNYKHGDTNPRVVEIKAGVEVKIGDNLYRDSAVNPRFAIPASLWPWTTDLGTTQAAAQAQYLGVATEYVSATQTDRKCLVNTTGVHEFDLPSGAAAINPGDPLGPADSGSSTLMNQRVAASTAARAVATAYEYTPANSLKVYANIRSRVFWGPVA